LLDFTFAFKNEKHFSLSPEYAKIDLNEMKKEHL